MLIEQPISLPSPVSAGHSGTLGFVVVERSFMFSFFYYYSRQSRDLGQCWLPAGEGLWRVGGSRNLSVNPKQGKLLWVLTIKIAVSVFLVMVMRAGQSPGSRLSEGGWGVTRAATESRPCIV